MEQIAYLKSHKFYRKYNNQILNALENQNVTYKLDSTKFGKRVLVNKQDLPTATKVILSIPRTW